jgi:uncharacterized membrane protein
MASYTLEIGNVFSEAWQRTKGFKLKAWGAVILLYAIMFGVMFGLTFLLKGDGSEPPSPLNALLPVLIMYLIVFPLAAGLLMMSIHHAAGKPVSIGMLFGYFHKTLHLFFQYILMMILIGIGFLLLILPGIYLMVAYYFAMPLLVEKNMGIWEALETSRKAVTQSWFTVFAIFILVSILIVVSMIPVGLGLIWTVPMSLVLYGVMYKTMFGVK